MNPGLFAEDATTLAVQLHHMTASFLWRLLFSFYFKLISGDMATPCLHLGGFTNTGQR